MDTRFGARKRLQLAILANGVIYALALVPSLFDVLSWPFWLRVVMLLAGFALSIWINRSQAYLPLLNKQHAYATKIMDIIVDDFLRQYQERVASNVAVRVNVMKPAKRYPLWSFGPRPLRIHYSRGAYDPAELQLEYMPMIGCCGQAFARNEPVYFERPQDDERARQQEIVFGLSPIQGKVTRDVGSGLSVPIYRPDDVDKETPIGVINFDALQSTLEQTRFDDAVTVNLAIIAAGMTGILFE